MFNVIISDNSNKVRDKDNNKFNELKELYNKLKEENISLSKQNWKNKELINSKTDYQKELVDLKE